MNLTIDTIQANIQLALAPVFLLTAVATLVTAITARLARNVDRMRFIQNELYSNHELNDKLRLHYEKEIIEFKTRGRLCTLAISLTVLELFFLQTGAARIVEVGYVVITFVAGLVSFVIALALILVEVVFAYRSTSWDLPTIDKSNKTRMH
jgi:uncharacterized membrane protein